MKKFLMLILSFAVLLSTITCNVSAEGDFEMKEFDKAYITFVFDDGYMPFTKQCHNLFKSYDLPACYAVIANKVVNNPELIDVLKNIEKSGGKVLSHTFSHSAFSQKSTVEDFEYQLGRSYTVLSALGFNINGVIEAGSGGAEAYADYTTMETVTRKYYKYSNAYGVSPQYKKKRTWFRYSSDKVAFSKATIDDAIKNKEWVVFAAHTFDEISYDDLSEVLKYIKSKPAGQVEVVTWNHIYKNFGEYTGPQIPSKEATESVNKYLAELKANESSSSSKNSAASSSNNSNSQQSNNNTTTNNTTNNSTVNNNTTNSSTNNNTIINSTTNNSTVNSTANNNITQSSETAESASSNISTSSTQTETEQTNVKKDKKSNKMIWLAIGIVAATLLIGGGILFFAIKYQNKLP